jgi:hypothetical protein
MWNLDVVDGKPQTRISAMFEMDTQQARIRPNGAVQVGQASGQPHLTHTAICLALNSCRWQRLGKLRHAVEVE